MKHLIHRILRRPLLGAFVCVLAQAPAAVQPAKERVAGYVTEISGSATLRSKAGAKEVDIMAKLLPGSHLHLAKHAEVTVFQPATAESVILRGPGTYLVDERTVRAVSAAPTIKHRALNPMFTGLRFSNKLLMQASLVMRSGAADIELQAPVGVLAQTADVHFVWRAAEHINAFDFELADLDGNIIHKVRALSSAFVLPPQITLRPATGYMWSVKPAPEATQRAGQTARFDVVSSDEKAHRDALRPAPGAARSDWLVYVAWLDSAGYPAWAREVALNCCRD